jgi:hypothetical protein
LYISVSKKLQLSIRKYLLLPEVTLRTSPSPGGFRSPICRCWLGSNNLVTPSDIDSGILQKTINIYIYTHSNGIFIVTYIYI